MKKLLPILLLVVILSVGYVALRMVPADNPRPARPVKLASGSWEPFIGPNLERNGPIAIIVSETFQRMGYEPEISFWSWDLILEQTRGEALGAFPFILSSEREELYDSSDPIVEFEYVLFFNTSRIENPDDIQDAEDLRKYRFGKVRGYEVWKGLRDAVAEPSSESKSVFKPYDTSIDAFRALAKGEIDFLPEGRLAGLAITQGPYILADKNEFGILGDSWVDDSRPDYSRLFRAKETVHFLMPKSDESRKFLDSFNHNLEEVKKTSVYTDAVAQITSAQQEIVELRPVPGEGYITVVAADNETRFRVPLGTRAVVVEWPESFNGQGDPESDGPIDCKVKLLNGPQRGRVVFVDACAMTLVW